MNASYDYSEEAVKALVDWFKDKTLPKEATLDVATQIFDVQKFVDANIFDINDHYPDPFFNPSIDRLYQLKAIMEEV